MENKHIRRPCFICNDIKSGLITFNEDIDLVIFICDDCKEKHINNITKIYHSFYSKLKSLNL